MIFKGETESLNAGIEELQKEGALKSINENISIIAQKSDNGLEISGNFGQYKILYEEKVDFFRAITLLNGKIALGEVEINFSETRKLKSNGIMLDCSRNAVFKPSAVKNMIRRIASMGMNRIMLYTEDTFCVEEYPYFGYMRGAYTKDELHEIDKYAQMFGVELIPCIQTLGHLAMALRWPFADGIKDNFHVLLCDEEKTYEFIRAMLKTCRECFSSNKIHIGMDEAPSVGLGAYLDKHGYHERFEILSRHLKKVCSICEELNFKPMMWADMFFRIASKTRSYYDTEVEFPQNVIESVPQNLSMVYWDYSSTDKKRYGELMDKHKELGREVFFAGGFRTWTGLGINHRDGFRVIREALSSCHEKHINNVFLTLWGDDGAETNAFVALAGIALNAEYTYYKEVSDKLLEEHFSLLTGYQLSDFLALDLDVYPEEWCHKPNVYGGNGGATISKNILYQDVLLGFFDKNVESIDLPLFYSQRLQVLNNAGVPSGYEIFFDYYKQLLAVLRDKCHIGVKITDAYKKQDRDELRKLVDDLGTLYSNILILHKMVNKVWLSTNKPFGMERLDVRYGGNLMRIKVAMERLNDFINGKIKCIEELEEKRLMYGGENVKEGKSLVEDQFYSKFAMPASEGFIAQ